MKNLIKTATLACLLVVAGSALANAETRIRVGGTGTPGSPDTKVIELFKQRVEAALGTDVKIELYPSSQLGTWSEMVEQVKGGVLECLYESVGDLGDYTPAANVEGVAYLYRDEDHFFRIWRGAVGKEVIDTIAKEAGVRVLGPGFRGFRQFLVKKPVASLADMQGMKVRVPGIPAYIVSIQALGVNPTAVAFEETYAALQQGVVDGLEQPLVAIKDHRFYEVAKHLVMTNHMAETMGLMCGEAWYESLDDKTKSALSDAADVGADWYRQYTRDNTDKIIAELKAEGVTVHTPNLDEFAKQAASAVFDPKLQPLITKMRSVN